MYTFVDILYNTQGLLSYKLHGNAQQAEEEGSYCTLS